MFEVNYESLKLEGGHSISRDFKELAFQQVLLYWQKLRDVAENVTDTEVKLTLPNQKTPKQRDYTVEGVVDIIREHDRTVMYDIKTHDAEYIRRNTEDYSKQLNVYAYIWQVLRHQQLDEASIISTAVPDSLRQAISGGDESKIAAEMDAWAPVIEVPFDASKVTQAIQEFGEVVDSIEDKRFAPATVSKLRDKQGTRSAFATRVCRNCDARFSCDSYRDYATQSGARTEFKFASLVGVDPESADERSERIAANLPDQ
jgi:hypothetical protein